MIGVIFTLLHAYGVYLGVRLVDGHEPVWQLAFWFALQLPTIQSPLFLYRFSTCLGATVGFVGFQPTVDLRFGNLSQLLFGTDLPFGLGINLVSAIIIFILCSPALYRHEAGRDTQAPTYDY